MDTTAKKVIDITQEECDAIEALYEKKMGLENLGKIIDVDSNEGLYNRMIIDYGKVSIQFNDWWEQIFVTYSIQEGDYRIDFDNKQLLEN